jgi:hypothetical protein
MEDGGTLDVMMNQAGSIGIFATPEEHVLSQTNGNQWKAATKMPGAAWLCEAAGTATPPPAAITALALAISPEAAFSAVDDVRCAFST